VAWNAFVDIVAMESPDDLSEIQQHAHFAFWYDSEVENGGHLQYFENHGTLHADATMHALEAVEAIAQRDVLAEALKRWNGTPRRKVRSLGEYAATARQGEFDDLDKAYWRCQPEMTVCLQRYLDSHFADFMELE